jgi:type II secretory pathway pseudopilin PulG
MLVVLVILALLAIAAVQSLSPVADQARFDVTTRTLNQVQAALIGDQGLRQPDGTPLITGFVADVGRLPILQGTAPETQLLELWDTNSTNNALVTSFPFLTRLGPTTPTDYSAVQLPCGWRGPYLRFGVGTTAELFDGWKNSFTLTADGSNHLQAVTWLAVSPYSENLNVAATAGLVTVSGAVTNNGATPTSATVVLLYPDPSQTTLAVMSDADGSVSGFSFANVPVGLRAIHATIDGHVVIKYVHVVQPGVSLNINYQP